MYRLRELWPDYRNRVRIEWKALALEWKNENSTPKHIVDDEFILMARQEMELPISAWRAPDWTYPVTFLPAFEAIRCAVKQGEQQGWEFSWRVRVAFFKESRNVAMRHVLLELAAESGLDVEQFRRDWDDGAERRPVLEESEHGWEELKVDGSPTFVLANGRQIHNPGAWRVTWGPKHTVQKVEPAERPWREVYREFLEEAAGLSAPVAAD